MSDSIKVKKMVGPNGEEVLVNAYESEVWQAKGFKIEKKAKKAPKPEKPKIDPREAALIALKLPRIRRLAADLGISQANILAKPELVAEVLKTEWTLPEKPSSKE